jgi:hypothetical protein
VEGFIRPADVENSLGLVPLGRVLHVAHGDERNTNDELEALPLGFQPGLDCHVAGNLVAGDIC